VSVSRHHADWLSLVESSGPFLSLPVLLRAFPQGLDPREPEQAKQLRLAYEEWQENPGLAAKQRTWVMHVLTQVLLYPKELLAEGQTLPPGLTATMAEYGETLRPDLALVGPTGGELAGKSQLLISRYPVEQSLDKPVTGKHWKATPGTRMMELLHATDVPLGLVTNGEEWMLVFAPRGDTTGFTSWYASLWIDEPITLRAFHSLLSTRRFFGVAPSDALLALLKESAQDQQEVTNQLGDQVRDAVEVLIQAFDRLDQDSGRTLLKGLDEKSLYDAALTVMMRLVFLFSAEERGLLHLGEPLYDDNYAVSTLREQLQEVADHYGEEVLERRHDGWARLLASFRAVHGGVNHQDLMLPAYGGSLFDPDRYPFLEGRTQGTRWQSSPAAPLEINNRVVLHLLKSLQMLQVKVPGGGPAEALRVSFEGLNIEQIGHVYEGLLDHTAVRAKEVVLGLAASRKKPVASITLAELEKLRQDDEAKLIELLEEETGRSGKALEKALNNGGEPEDFHKLLHACGQDKELAAKIIPFRGLLRQDSFERLVVVLPGGIYVGQGSARRSTGTHYTPRSLTEPIVQHTLEPLVYRGPAEGLTKEQWCLRPPKEILDLKVCDMAMGSGAFLVQACRYLSERLAEAWESLEKEHPGEVLITPEGGFSQGEPSERLIPIEAAERLAIARRLVADRCLYGVDINPMAVEMAKLSIWLITVDKSRPFTFLDHALKCGDSLLGISRFKQLETFSLDSERAKQVIILSNYDELIRIAVEKRRQLEMLPSNDPAQITAKKALNADAEGRLINLKLAADLLILAELTAGNEQQAEMARAGAHLKVTELIRKPATEFCEFVNDRLGNRRPLHWPLEFPEILSRGGFDAFVGNPPFMGGGKISGSLGDDYRNYLVLHLANGQRGAADLCAYFFLRVARLLRADGANAGLIATNTISQGDTREVGLRQLADGGSVFTRAVPSIPWPGTAALEVAHVWFRRGAWSGAYFINEMPVLGITSFLTASSAHPDAPKRLVRNLGIAFKGAEPGGLEFLLTKEEAKPLLAAADKNSEVVLPFVNGEDLNSSPSQEGSRFTIYFGNRSHEEVVLYPECYGMLRSRLSASGGELAGKWWRYRRPALELQAAVKDLQWVFACAIVTKHLAISLVPRQNVMSKNTIVFATNKWAFFACVQSTLHELWAREFSSTLETRLNFSPTDCFETFPFPPENDVLDEIGLRYHEHRRQTMLARSEGLTDVYNRFHDPTDKATDVTKLRDLCVEMDQRVADGYELSNLHLGHDFHKTKQGVRFTIDKAARSTVLDRLRTLNQKRYEQEIEAGLHQKKVTGAGKRSSGKNKVSDDPAQRGLYLETEPKV
jgi:Eco57I restriction-modification methylase/restriction-modification enzyme MmeI-like protein